MGEVCKFIQIMAERGVYLTLLPEGQRKGGRFQAISCVDGSVRRYSPDKLQDFLSPQVALSETNVRTLASRGFSLFRLSRACSVTPEFMAGVLYAWGIPVDRKKWRDYSDIRLVFARFLYHGHWVPLDSVVKFTGLSKNFLRKRLGNLKSLRVSGVIRHVRRGLSNPWDTRALKGIVKTKLGPKQIKQLTWEVPDVPVALLVLGKKNMKRILGGNYEDQHLGI